MADARRMKPVFTSAEDLLTVDAAYWVEADVLRFAIPVPIIAKDGQMMEAYKLESG